MRSTRTKMRRKLNRRIKVFLLFYLAIITIYITSISLSKFMGEASGSGTTSVAKWYVEANLDEEAIDLINGTTTSTCNVVVLSTSDVSCKYSIILTDLPNGLEVAIDEEEFIEVSNNTVEFTDVGAFATNEETENIHTLKFRAPLELAEETDREVNIDVIFVQDEL